MTHTRHALSLTIGQRLRTAIAADPNRMPRRLTSLAALVAIAVAFFAATTPAKAADDIGFKPQVSLTAANPHELVGESSTLKASALYIDIPSSPYYLRIYDTQTGTMLKQCNANVCDVSVTASQASSRSFRAYITNSSGFPPASYAAASNTQTVTWSNFVINATPTFLAAGQTSTVTAKAAGTAAKSESITIRDAMGTTIKTCGAGVVSCPVDVKSSYARTRTFTAVQKYWPNGIGNGSAVEYQSNTTSVTWYSLS